MPPEHIEDETEGQKSKRQRFFDLAERFRNAADAEETIQLGDQPGRIVFGE